MQQRHLIELGVLGLLSEREGTLETIQERFNHSFGWHQFAGHGVLEPTIARLREEGMVYGSRAYDLTELGRERLQVLLCEPVSNVDDPAHRPHLLMKLGFLHHLSQSTQYDELAHLEDQFYQARAEWIEAANAHDEAERVHSGYRLELIDLTIQLIDTQLEWIESLRQSLVE